MEVSCMNKSAINNKELIGYIERCIPDIARKCGCTNHEVIETFKQFIKNENKN
jgi:hypothetical protein